MCVGAVLSLLFVCCRSFHIGELVGIIGERQSASHHLSSHKTCQYCSLPWHHTLFFIAFVELLFCYISTIWSIFLFFSLSWVLFFLFCLLIHYLSLLSKTYLCFLTLICCDLLKLEMLIHASHITQTDESTFSFTKYACASSFADNLECCRKCRSDRESQVTPLLPVSHWLLVVHMAPSEM